MNRVILTTFNLLMEDFLKQNKNKEKNIAVQIAKTAASLKELEHLSSHKQADKNQYNILKKKQK